MTQPSGGPTSIFDNPSIQDPNSPYDANGNIKPGWSIKGYNDNGDPIWGQSGAGTSTDPNKPPPPIAGRQWGWDGNSWVSYPLPSNNVSVSVNPEGIGAIQEARADGIHLISRDRNGNILSDTIIPGTDPGTSGMDPLHPGRAVGVSTVSDAISPTGFALYRNGQWIPTTENGQPVGAPKNLKTSQVQTSDGADWLITYDANGNVVNRVQIGAASPRAASSGGTRSAGSGGSGGGGDTGVSASISAAASQANAQLAAENAIKLELLREGFTGDQNALDRAATALYQAGTLSQGLLGIKDKRASDIINNLSNPSDMVAREYSARALNAPPGSPQALFGDTTGLEGIISRLLSNSYSAGGGGTTGTGASGTGGGASTGTPNGTTASSIANGINPPSSSGPSTPMALPAGFSVPQETANPFGGGGNLGSNQNSDYYQNMIQNRENYQPGGALAFDPRTGARTLEAPASAFKEPPASGPGSWNNPWDTAHVGIDPATGQTIGAGYPKAAHGGIFPGSSAAVVGDPQRPGKPNPELVVGQNFKVIPMNKASDMVRMAAQRMPHMADGGEVPDLQGLYGADLGNNYAPITTPTASSTQSTSLPNSASSIINSLPINTPYTTPSVTPSTSVSTFVPPPAPTSQGGGTTPITDTSGVAINPVGTTTVGPGGTAPPKTDTQPIATPTASVTANMGSGGSYSPTMGYTWDGMSPAQAWQSGYAAPMQAAGWGPTGPMQPSQTIGQTVTPSPTDSASAVVAASNTSQPPATTTQPPGTTINTYPNSAYQNYPPLAYIQGRMPASQYMNLNTGSAAGAFDTTVPYGGAINYSRALDIMKDPDSYASLGSLYKSANLSLASEIAKALLRAPVGNARKTSEIET